MPDDQHGDRRIRHRIDLAKGDSRRGVVQLVAEPDELAVYPGLSERRAGPGRGGTEHRVDPIEMVL